MITIHRKEQCCGCTACIAVCPKQCIRMVTDREGFAYPEVDTKLCIQCGLCEKVCPCLNEAPAREPIASYAAVHQEEQIRMASSSGGLFTAFAEETLRQGGVVFGVRHDDTFGLIHAPAETAETLAAFRGSKYVQSDMRDCYRQAEALLKAGREVLFSGVGCQIAGLKAFLRKEYPRLLTVEILCHGVASPKVWQTFLTQSIQKQGYAREALQQVAFRDKKNGWKQYDMLFRLAPDNEFRFSRKENPYMKGYFANLYLRPSCHHCPRRDFSSGSDLTLGDCWGIEKQPPQPYCADNKGVSLVMVNTTKGAERLEAIRPSIRQTAIDYHTVERYNPAIHHRPAKNPKRERFFARLNNGEPFDRIIASLTRPSLGKRIEELCTPLLKALGIKGFTKRFRKS